MRSATAEGRLWPTASHPISPKQPMGEATTLLQQMGDLGEQQDPRCVFPPPLFRAALPRSTCCFPPPLPVEKGTPLLPSHPTHQGTLGLSFHWISTQNSCTYFPLLYPVNVSSHPTQRRPKIRGWCLRTHNSSRSNCPSSVQPGFLWD